MTGTCPGGIRTDSPIFRNFAKAIAQTISLLKPREFVEIEVGPLSPIPYLEGITTYVCVADKRLLKTLRESRQHVQGFTDTQFVEMDVLQAYTFFNHPETVFYTSRFVGCYYPDCEHCQFYATFDTIYSQLSLTSPLDHFAPDSQLVFPLGTTKLVSGEVEVGIDVLWGTHVRNNVFLSLVRKQGLRRLNSDSTHHRNARS